MAGLGGSEADEGEWVDTSNLFINLTWIQFGLVKIIAVIYLSTYLSIYLSILLSTYLLIYLFIYLSIHLSIYLSI